MILLAVLAVLALAGTALVAWGLATLLGPWVWPLAAGLACLFLVLVIPGRDAWRLWIAEGLRKRFE